MSVLYKENIAGYTFGQVQQAPITEDDLNELKKAVMFSDDDVEYLRKAGEILKDQIDDVLDLWYGFVGSQPHLVYYFFDKSKNEPDSEYLAKVRDRFGQWILDTCFRAHDQEWINYQYEIGLRHHRTKKNQTDNVNSIEHIPMRYLIAFIYPISATIRQFLSKKESNPEEVDKMFHAWFKAVVLQVALWCHPYAKENDW